LGMFTPEATTTYINNLHGAPTFACVCVRTRADTLPPPATGLFSTEDSCGTEQLWAIAQFHTE
jgi:hypothetical protein